MIANSIRKAVEQLLEELRSENNIVIDKKYILTTRIEGNPNTLIVPRRDAQVRVICDHDVLASLISVQLVNGTVRRTIVDRDQHEIPKSLLIKRLEKIE